MSEPEMSLLDAPMALLDRVLGRGAEAVRPDDPVARMVARTTGRLRPTRGYRRRLRGRVVNQYVAVREGLADPPRRRREMGVIGRSVLYASMALAVGVTAVGAASGSALPGDPLYPVKRQIEAIRIEIAPAWARPNLIAASLNERLTEVEALARDGRWNQIDQAVAEVQAAEQALRGTGSRAPTELSTLDLHEQVLTSLLANAPAAARPGLERALAVSTSAAAQLSGSSHANGADHANGNAAGPNHPAASAAASGSETPAASPSPHPGGHSPSPSPAASTGTLPSTPPLPSPSAH